MSYHATSQTESRDKDLCNEKYVLYWNWVMGNFDFVLDRCDFPNMFIRKGVHLRRYGHYSMNWIKQKLNLFYVRKLWLFKTQTGPITEDRIIRVGGLGESDIV